MIMTDLQKKEFEILKYFINICEKLNLTYYLVCGSALGAVKYQGFIPWDDDIDVAMPREDYEVFCNSAQQYLPDNIFVQTYRTDFEFPQIFCKLRNSDTTYIEEAALKLNINHGIFIDVFPLDGYPKKKISMCLFEIKKRLYQSVLLSAYEIKRSGKSRMLYTIYRFLGITKNKSGVAYHYEKMIRKYKWENSSLIANHGNWQGKLEYAPKEQYGNGVLAEFEGRKVRIPEKYDEYLTQKYGDWRADLPIDEQQGHHYYTICDVNKSYIQYMNIMK